VFWSKSAERITGWTSDDVIGRACLEDILCHEDKDGHRLCGEEYCPLHRSMITGERTDVPLIVFARGKNNNRIPMHVTTAPIRNNEGEIIGGVEAFRDVSVILRDLEKARRIQAWSLEKDLLDDSRLQFSTLFMPRDIVGGDYYAIHSIDADRYGFLLADMEGHGIAAALYTIHLHSLWNKHVKLMRNPVEFTSVFNDELGAVVGKEASFATAICGVIDVQTGKVGLVGAGGPPPFIIRANGEMERVSVTGLALGILEGVSYNEVTAQLEAGDSLLLVSDGAFEIHDVKGQMLGVNGFMHLLSKLDYPRRALRLDVLEEELLKFSNEIRLKDDVTIIEIKWLG